jgi:hypothetical protein
MLTYVGWSCAVSGDQDGNLDRDLALIVGAASVRFTEGASGNTRPAADPDATAMARSNQSSVPMAR